MHLVGLNGLSNVKIFHSVTLQDLVVRKHLMVSKVLLIRCDVLLVIIKDKMHFGCSIEGILVMLLVLVSEAYYLAKRIVI